ncbi:MAG TPA: FkbM family methyltransferase [Baekduia sp.]|nr:FkbM family methyltransferase [Baekduia sp.]
MRTLLTRAVPQRTYRLKGGIARGLKRRGLGLRELLGQVPADTEEIALMRAQDLGGLTIFDIGADLGYFTSFFADRAGALGRVVSFEPNPASYEKTLEQVRLNDLRNVTVLNVACGDRDGELTMAIGSAPGEGSANPDIRQAMLAEGPVSEIVVRAVRVDTIIRERGLPAPDFVKIDVEGLELPVLQGMTETLAKSHPRLFIELHGIGMAAKKANAEGVVQLLLDNSYEILHVESGSAITSAGEAPPEGHLLCKAKA